MCGPHFPAIPLWECVWAATFSRNFNRISTSQLQKSTICTFLLLSTDTTCGLKQSYQMARQRILCWDRPHINPLWECPRNALAPASSFHPPEYNYYRIRHGVSVSEDGIRQKNPAPRVSLITPSSSNGTWSGREGSLRDAPCQKDSTEKRVKKIHMPHASTAAQWTLNRKP